MKTRPHIVMQTCLYDTAGLQRNAGLLAARIGTAARLKDVLGYTRVLIRVMKIILDLTLHNNCFALRREVLESPRLRRSVMERLGGAQALLRWRRQNAWNTARLAAITFGKYRPAASRDFLSAVRQASPRNLPDGAQPSTDASLPAAPIPAKFRLPVLQNLQSVHRPRVPAKRRAKPQKRFPAVVLWPHELDGQYVPDFKSRMRVPAGDAYQAYASATPPAGYSARPIFAPP